MKNLFPKTNGFTLIEVLLYLSLMVIVLMGITSFAQNIFSVQNKSKIISDVDYESNYALDLISSYIQKDKINSPLIFSSSTSLSLNDKDNNQIIISLINNQINITSSNGSSTPITSNKIKISNLSFINLGLPNTSGLIKINWTADNNTESESKDYNFTNNYETYATNKN